MSHLQLAPLIRALEAKHTKDHIEFAEFDHIISGHNFIKRVLENTLIIPQFQFFVEKFEKCFKDIK